MGSYKRKPMIAAISSADGPVLAIAIEIAVTIWDLEMIVQVACQLFMHFLKLVTVTFSITIFLFLTIVVESVPRKSLLWLGNANS